MERMERLNPEIEKLFRAKEQRRRRLAAMPVHEKVKAIVRMQQMAAPVLLSRGKQVRIWKLEPSDAKRD
jgi:hypothetical protein